MARSISSAEPEKLFRYSDFGARLDHDLVSESYRLATRLQHFEATCTEPGYQVSVSHLAHALRGYGSQSESTDGWVRQVGKDFQIADQVWSGARFLPGVWAGATWALPGWALGVSSVVALLPLLPVPNWLEKLVSQNVNILFPGGAETMMASAVQLLAPGFGVWVTKWLPEHTKGGVDLGFVGREHKLWPERRGRPRKNRPERKLRIAAWKDDLWETDPEKGKGHTRLGGVRLGGKAEAKAFKGELGGGIDLEGESKMAGLYAAGTVFTAGASGVVGSTDLGLGVGGDVTVGKAELFAGFKDGRVGAKVGGILASVEGTVGANVAGWNVGLTGEVGVKFELGLDIEISKYKKTRVYLGPFTIGLNIGEALGS